MNKASLLDNIKGLSIIILGDIMLDRYLYGSVDRISPEAPVPILDFTSQEEKLGGAGNVAVNVAALGAEVDICAIIGNDEEGKKITELLESKSINSDFLVQLDSRPTTLKTRVLGGKQHLLRVDREDKSELSQDKNELLLNYINKITWKDYDLVILQDYDKGFFSSHILSAIITSAKAHGCYIAVDPKTKNFWNYKGVDLIKPNKNEASAVLNKSIDDDTLSSAASEIAERLDCKEVLITLGAGGNFYYNKATRQEVRSQAEPVEIADVCGAGDAVISVAAPLLALDVEAENVLSISNKIGAYICLHVGVTEISRIKLEEIF